MEFSKKVELAAGETNRAVCGPGEFQQLIIHKPKLWWPRNYGEQNLHHLKLTFEAGGAVSDSETVTFGIRKVTSEIYQYKGTPGLRVHVNGQRVTAQGGWLQPDMLLDSPAARTEAEVRYLAEANFNTVTFEDLPAPNDAFLDGSRVALRLDGKPVAFKRAWARAGGKESLGFPLTLDKPGRREIALGGQKISVIVQP